MVIPIGGSDGTQEAEREASRTYRLNPFTGRISGMTDGVEAVRQAVFKILQTDRFIHTIYYDGYGNEIRMAVDRSPAELEPIIRDALVQDDRIEGISDFKVDVTGDSAAVRFTVLSVFGTFQVEQEVS